MKCKQCGCWTTFFIGGKCSYCHYNIKRDKIELERMELDY